MTTRYSVVQYVPNPLNGESINIGVIGWSDQAAVVQFVKNFARARQFGGKEIGFLRGLSKELIATVKSRNVDLFESDSFNKEELEKMILNWGGCIQFTSPRGSLEPVEQVVQSAASLFLVEPRLRRRIGRSKAQAVSIAYKHVREAVLKYRPKDTEKLIHKREVVQGSLEPHKFDVVLKNGHLVGALNALSFEAKSSGDWQREVDSLAWSIDDVRKNDKSLPVGVYLLKGTSAEARRQQQRVDSIIGGLGAKVIESDSQLDAWADKAAAAFG